MDDLHVEQSEKAAPKPEAERDRGFRFKIKRGIVQAEFIKRLSQRVKLICVCWIQAAEHKRFHLAITGQGCFSGSYVICDGIADFRFVNFSDASDEVSDSAGLEF